MSVRDYSKGDEFVPSGAFGEVSEKPRGPRQPSVTDPGGASQVVMHGGAWGDIQNPYDGGLDASRLNSTKRTKLFTGKHLPENA